MKKLIRYFIPVTVEQIEARMQQIKIQREMYYAIIDKDKLTVKTKTRPPVIPEGWKQNAGFEQIDTWHKYVKGLRHA